METEIDISLTEYDVELITEKNVRYVLNETFLSLQWEEQSGELAQHATIALSNKEMGLL